MHLSATKVGFLARKADFSRWKGVYLYFIVHTGFTAHRWETFCHVFRSKNIIISDQNFFSLLLWAYFQYKKIEAYNLSLVLSAAKIAYEPWNKLGEEIIYFVIKISMRIFASQNAAEASSVFPAL